MTIRPIIETANTDCETDYEADYEADYLRTSFSKIVCVRNCNAQFALTCFATCACYK